MELEDFDFKKAFVTKECFENFRKYQEKYGKNTFIITQIGDFYEVYGLLEIEDDEDENIIMSNILEFSKVAELNIVNKNSVIKNKVNGKSYQLKMAGFKCIKIDSYLKNFQKANYTTVIIDQKGTGINSDRYLSRVISPGTYFFDESIKEIENVSNNMCCMWFELNSEKAEKREISIGLANIDCYSGKSFLAEYSYEYKKLSTTYDTLEKYVSIFNPSECILISSFEDNEINMILDFIRLKNKKIHKINSLKNKKTKNCEKQTYQKKILEYFFEFDNFSVFIHDFNNYIVATQAYCFLLDFINGCKTNIVKNIEKPVFENFTNKLVLGNHSLHQLNIIDDNNTLTKGKYSSIHKMLNECVTAMGKRHFKINLMNATTDVSYLNNEYNIIENFLNIEINEKNIFIGHLKKINDIDKLIRFIVNKKVRPKHVYMLYTTLLNSLELYKRIKNNHEDIMLYLKKNHYSFNSKIVNEFVVFLEENFTIENCKAGESSENSIRLNKNDKLYELQKNQVESNDSLKLCVKYLNELIGNDFVNIHETDKKNISLKITMLRSKILKEKLDNQENKKIKMNYISSFTGEKNKFILDLDDIYFDKHTKTNFFIKSLCINTLCSNVTNLNQEIISLSKETYIMKIEEMENFIPILKKISEFVKITDFILCKALTSIKYNLCKPEIQDLGYSYVEAKNMRHPIIEFKNSDEFFTPNDIFLRENGLLLYGFNNAGKSSIIKALGITIILAQIGYYVPCSSFKFFPYDHLFTRIVNSDNIYEGTGTFVTEMLELRKILLNATSKSLILGDELCSGTEMASAESIIVQTLKYFTDIKSTFIFATHFHKILEYPEIQNIINDKKLQIKHLDLYYDDELKKKVYNRKLSDGSGSKFYGLEAIRSLDLPESFLNSVDEFRLRYYPLSHSILEQKTSKYNSNIVMFVCQECNTEMSTESHHKYLQKDADENGFIKTKEGIIIHKNHPKNIITVCNNCHKNIHKNIK